MSSDVCLKMTPISGMVFVTTQLIPAIQSLFFHSSFDYSFTICIFVSDQIHAVSLWK